MISDLKDGTTIEKSPLGVSEQTLKQIIPTEITNLNPNNIITLGVDIDIITELLQNRIYTRKDIAYQEITTNGRDAILRRIKLGDTNFKPEVQIILNYNDNTISIIDNGCGISEEKIQKLYRFYGRSDKRDDMNETGMFGLGKFTPFALVDEFTLITDSMEDKTRREYVVTKRGLIPIITGPSISHGTTVTFSNVADHDVEDITTTCQSIFSTWKCPVNLYTISDDSKVFALTLSSQSTAELSEIGEGKYPEVYGIKIDTADYVAYLSTEAIDKTRVYIGFVPYKVDTSTLNIPNALFNRYEVNMSIFIKNPNIITISATRENIEQDEKLKQVIINVNSKIKQETQRELKEAFGTEIDWKTFDPNPRLKETYQFAKCISERKNSIFTDYPTARQLFDNNYRYTKYNSHHRYQRSENLFDIYTEKKTDCAVLKWSPAITIKLGTVPRDETVLHLNHQSGKVCRTNKLCTTCEHWKKEGNTCFRDYIKGNHFLENILPEFKPIKNSIPNKFRLTNLRNHMRPIFKPEDIAEESDLLLTTDLFKATDRMNGKEVYLISLNRLKDLLKLYPDIKKKIITKNDYFKSIKLTDLITDKELTISEITKTFKNIVVPTDRFFLDEEKTTIKKLHKIKKLVNIFAGKSTIFIEEYNAQTMIDAFKNKNIKVICYSDFVKNNALTVSMNCKMSLEFIMDLISKLENENTHFASITEDTVTIKRRKINRERKSKKA